MLNFLTTISRTTGNLSHTTLLRSGYIHLMSSVVKNVLTENMTTQHVQERVKRASFGSANNYPDTTALGK